MCHDFFYFLNRFNSIIFTDFFSSENLGSLHLPCPISRHSFNVFQMKLFTYETENYNVYQINLYKYPSECSTYWSSTKAVSPVSVKSLLLLYRDSDYVVIIFCINCTEIFVHNILFGSQIPWLNYAGVCLIETLLCFLNDPKVMICKSRRIPKCLDNESSEDYMTSLLDVSNSLCWRNVHADKWRNIFLLIWLSQQVYCHVWKHNHFS